MAQGEYATANHLHIHNNSLRLHLFLLLKRINKSPEQLHIFYVKIVILALIYPPNFFRTSSTHEFFIRLFSHCIGGSTYIIMILPTLPKEKLLCPYKAWIQYAI